MPALEGRRIGEVLFKIAKEPVEPLRAHRPPHSLARLRRSKSLQWRIWGKIKSRPILAIEAESLRMKADNLPSVKV